MNDDVRTEIRDRVGVITLTASHRRNALTGAMARELAAAITALSRNARVGCLLLLGEGTVFCAGADRRLLARAADPRDRAARRELEDVYASFVSLGTADIPSVAAVQGWAIGAGCNLALAADLLLMADSAQLRAGFARLEIHPGGGHVELVTRRAGLGVATAMALFDQPLTGPRATELGLAWATVPENLLEDRACELASNAARSPRVARLITASLRQTPHAAAWSDAVERDRPQQLHSLAESRVLRTQA